MGQDSFRVIGLKLNNKSAESKMGAEANSRRKSMRLPLKVRCKYGLRKNDGAGRIIVSGFTINFSEKGLGIEGKKGLPPNSNILIMLYTGQQEIKLECQTKWLRAGVNKENWRMGLEITSSLSRIGPIYKSMKSRGDFDLPEDDAVRTNP